MGPVSRSVTMRGEEGSGGGRPVNDVSWNALYRVAGAAALITAVLLPVQIATFIIWTPPIDGTVAEWFTYFDDSPVVAMLNFDLLLIVEMVLLVPIVLALYLLLRKGSQSLMLIGTALWLMSAVLYIAGNTAFEMLSLSSGYAGAVSDAERAIYLAAGQAMLASWIDGGSAWTMGYVLGSVAGILVGVGMLRAVVFSRWAAYAIIAASLMGLAIFIPVIGIPLSLGSVVVIIAWYALVGWRLLQLASVSQAARA